MCEFFSFITNGQKKVFYFDAKQRDEIEGVEDFDSHSEIANYYLKTKPAADRCNKFEYTMDDEFKVDQINVKDDSDYAKNWVEKFIDSRKYVDLIKWKYKDSNSGNWNSGDRNSGNRNSGDRNSGDWNSGYRNSGDRNSGYRNSGDRNSGDWNSGYRNSGDSNSGNWNSGYRNSGDSNSGNRNSGDWNSGDRNSGDRNSGDWNSGDWNSGFFNSTTPKTTDIFNKPCDREVWDNAIKPNFIYININSWVSEFDMTDKEKLDNTNYKIVGGYLKTIDYKKAWKEAYSKATKEEIKLLKALPNFDSDVFFEISGIKV